MASMDRKSNLNRNNSGHVVALGRLMTDDDHHRLWKPIEFVKHHDGWDEIKDVFTGIVCALWVYSLSATFGPWVDQAIRQWVG